MTDVGPLYREGRERISGLVRDLDDEGLATLVPACPEWRVKDVVSHLSGICADIINGNLEGVASDPWTTAQVQARKEWTVEKLLEEWDEYAPQCEAIAQHFPDGADVQWLADLTTHEHDLRGALDRPGERDTEAVRMGFEWLVQRFGENALAPHGLPPVRFASTEGDEVVAGNGTAGASVKGSRFELFRILTGRRSVEQIVALDWHGDAERYLPAFEWGPFRPAASAVTE
jgi:uncharacterized protein (TIGR03083 family)